MADAKIIQSAGRKRYVTYRQFSGENICWALAAKSVLYNTRNKKISVCEIVSKTKKLNNCCSVQQNVTDHCNKGDYIENALAQFGVKTIRQAVNFKQVYSDLQNNKVVAMVTDMSNSTFGSRQGHVAIIHYANLHSDGSYTFYVADSANEYYSFDTDDLRLRKNGKYEYLSREISFDWEYIVRIF
ncbi:MAG: hypothetical protein R3A80_10220 [Bdellovibrionota bacterium]